MQGSKGLRIKHIFKEHNYTLETKNQCSYLKNECTISRFHAIENNVKQVHIGNFSNLSIFEKWKYLKMAPKIKLPRSAV